MSTYTEHLTKVQAETLATIKQAQDASLATFASARELATSYPASVPNPTEIVEQGYAFAGKLLDLQKSYALRVAEMIAGAQKQAFDTASRATKGAKGE